MVWGVEERVWGGELRVLRCGKRVWGWGVKGVECKEGVGGVGRGVTGLVRVATRVATHLPARAGFFQ